MSYYSAVGGGSSQAANAVGVSYCPVVGAILEYVSGTTGTVNVTVNGSAITIVLTNAGLCDLYGNPSDCKTVSANYTIP